MPANSKIEWTQATWNPVTGCSKISSGCLNCYAERMARRLQAMGSPRYKNGFQVALHEDVLDYPSKLRRPTMIFVNSMSDLFHEEVLYSFVCRVFDTMIRCPQHVFQLLTKRSSRLAEMAPDLPWPDNIWMGVTVEDAAAVARIADLEKVEAAVCFLSCEPLIGPLGILPLEMIDWVIVGGESGPGARPMQAEWIEDILSQCNFAEVPFFFKQWGGTRKKQSGRELHGRIYDEMPLR